MATSEPQSLKHTNIITNSSQDHPLNISLLENTLLVFMSPNCLPYLEVTKNHLNSLCFKDKDYGYDLYIEETLKTLRFIGDLVYL